MEQVNFFSDSDICEAHVALQCPNTLIIKDRVDGHHVGILHPPADEYRKMAAPSGTCTLDPELTTETPLQIST